MTALRPVAWEAWVAEGKVWLRLHPRGDQSGVPREERQRSFPKRAAFALVTAAENLPGRDLGAQPCELCGQWTHSWCEACSLRPFNAFLRPVRCRSPCLSTMPASWAVMGSGPRREYHTARFHRTQRLPRPDWQVCSGGPTAPLPTGGRVNRWRPRCRPVGPDGRRRVSGSYHEFFLTTPVWTSFCGSAASTRHNVGESLPYTRAGRELSRESAQKHMQWVLRRFSLGEAVRK